MSGDRRDEWIVVTDDARTVPVIEILTGRGFVTGKSGSGKSNSAGVIAEELLANGYNLLIVDTEGEYFGLKERYELLHVGGDDFADVRVSASHAQKIADISVRQNMPVILDVSGYDDSSDARALIAAVLQEIYEIEKAERKPFLVMVEEMQEYLPQQGSGGELGDLLERIAKRGRKRGMGLCGMSQRPSSVDKDFITQCDWMVWHRLTWETDLNVVRNILGSERASEIQAFDPGEGVLMTEWDDTVETVKFRRKRTHDAGATPGLESYDRPDLQTVGSELIREIKGEGAVADELDVPHPVSERSESSDEDDASPDLEEEVEPANPAEEFPDAPEDLRERLTAEQRRNEALSAEVDELRSILSGVEGTELAPTVDTHEPERSVPNPPPPPPRRPPNRTGLGGNLVEFGQMMVYLLRTTWYRLRVRYLHR